MNVPSNMETEFPPEKCGLLLFSRMEFIQEEADRNGQIDKEYVWTLSFPHCTEQLPQAMNRLRLALYLYFTLSSKVKIKCHPC